jgi:NADH-quinone oxidoreductase subunit M
MLKKVFLGPLRERWQSMRDLDGVETAVMISLLVPTLIIGVFPTWLINVIDATARAVVSR